MDRNSFEMFTEALASEALTEICSRNRVPSDWMEDFAAQVRLAALVALDQNPDTSLEELRTIAREAIDHVWRVNRSVPAEVVRAYEISTNSGRSKRRPDDVDRMVAQFRSMVGDHPDTIQVLELHWVESRSVDYVAQALHWSIEKAQQEIDFVIAVLGRVITRSTRA